MEKNRILEHIMETEKYKVAKEILDRYDTEGYYQYPRSYNRPYYQQNRSLATGSGLDIRRNLSIQGGRLGQKSPGSLLKALPGPSAERRTVMDRVIDFIVGEGEGYRCALICSNCRTHNGMALKEEFPYIGFKCFYCSYFNAARKQKPAAPRLEIVEMDESDDEDDVSEEGNKTYVLTREAITRILDGSKRSSE